MYSRYLPPESAFELLPLEEERQPNAEQPSLPPPQPRQESQPTPPPPRQNASPARGGAVGELLGGLSQELNKLLGGIFQFSLEDLDTGDILLTLIALFLFLEGDDLDLAIALGLTLLLSLGEPEQGAKPSSGAEGFRPAT